MRGVNGSWAELVIAHPDFGRMEGAACQHWCAALLLAHPALYSYLCLKFSFYEKATKFGAIFLKVLTLLSIKTLRTIAPNFCGLLRKAEL